MKTKLGKEFLKLVKLFFRKTSTLNKKFNKNTIKLSYSCLPKMKSIINTHNKKILNGSNNEPKLCICKKNIICPFNRKCLLKGKAAITKGNVTKEYIVSTGVSFKTSFKPNNSTQTSVSKYFRKFEDKENVKVQ